MNRSYLLLWGLLGLMMIGIWLLLRSFAGSAYPVLTTDAAAFLPPAATWEVSGELQNPVYPLNQRLGLDAADQRMLYYVPLYPMALGWLMPDTSVEAMYQGNHVLILLTLIAYSGFIALFIRRQTSLPLWLGLSLAAWGMIGLMTGLDARTGRPELLTHLLLWAGMATSFWKHEIGRSAIHGVIFGLMCFTHMLGGIYLGLLVAIYYTYKGLSLKEIASFAGGTLGTGLILLGLSPYSLPEMLEGVMLHLKMQAERTPPTWSGFIRSFVLGYVYTFYFFLFVAALVSVGLMSRRFFQRAKFPLLMGGAILLLLVVMGYFSFRTTETTYNLYLLAPVFFLLVLWPLAKDWKVLEGKRLVWPIALAGLFALLSIGMVKRTVLFVKHQQKGISHAQTTHELAQLPWDSLDKVGVSFSLFPLIESEYWDKIEVVSPHGLSALGSRFDLLILQQTYSGNKTPRDVPDYTLIRNNFLSNSVQFSGIKIANIIPGYQYALYQPAALSTTLMQP
ncbi:MAG: hypothetical protein AAFV07_02855 [Bacteroidota bacterium]